LYRSAWDYKSSVQQWADQTAQSIALQKAIQTWAAQWTAEKGWAGIGQMAKASGEIANVYGQQSRQAEAQRQAWLWQAAAMESAIPWQLSNIWAQNVASDLAWAQADYYNKLAQPARSSWNLNSLYSMVQKANQSKDFDATKENAFRKDWYTVWWISWQ
jgi:hypothetical protein